MKLESTDAILQELVLAKERKDYEACLALCREGARMSTSPEKEDWYVFRINLARFLLSDERRFTPQDVEEAMKVYSELASTLGTTNEAKKRATALMGMGWTYYLRTKDDTRNNLELAANAFTEALGYYTRESDPYMWASIKAALGLVYSSMGHASSNMWVSEAIKNYEEAVAVLTASDYPEDWKEITGNLHDLRDKAASLAERKG